ncbi:MAG TPA: ATP-binding cassette domain-containing protein [Mycobacteriales bacterium]|nr:ATP-binding cassette domain-containing protein [Mycobacteriales bacterium]
MHPGAPQGPYGGYPAQSPAQAGPTPHDLNPYAPIPGRIVVGGLTKQFKRVRAVDNLSFSVEPGTVTGFLGPNGAGKTTTLRMLLGLISITAGVATIGGRPYHDLGSPVRTVGAALEASSFHLARTGRNHLRIICAAAGIPEYRADQVLQLVGMMPAANRKVKSYSMGMKQRLGLAAGLLGDPQVLILDEPTNGLDPEGIRWMRGFLRGLAAQGRTVLVSSHLLAEVSQTVDDVVIIAHGQSRRQGKVADLLAEAKQSVRVRTSQADALLQALGNQVVARRTSATEIYIDNLSSKEVGRIALQAGVEVDELSTVHADLEDVFLQYTRTGASIR